MARKLNKLDRMAAVESIIGDVDLEDLVTQLGDLLARAETAKEAAETVAEAAAEAQGYHEERDWESRDDALTTMYDSLTEFGEAIDELDSFGDVMMVLRETIPLAHKAHTEALDHTDQLVEA